MKNIKKLAKRIFSISLAATLALSFSGCGSKGKSSDNSTSVTLGTTSWPTNMFYYLAEEKGFFKDNGVDVTVRDLHLLLKVQMP